MPAAKNRIMVIHKAKEGLNKRETQKEAWVDVEENKIENQDSNNSFWRFEEYLRRMKVTMAVFGVYHYHGICEVLDKGKKTPRLCYLSSAYNIFVLLLFLANFIRSLANFKDGTTEEFYAPQVIPALWLFQVCLIGTFMIKASHPKFGHQHRSCRFWREIILSSLDELGIEVDSESIKTRLTFGLSFGWLVIFSNFFALVVLSFLPFGTIAEAMESMLIKPLPVNTLSKILMLCLYLYSTVAWMSPMLYFALVSTLMNITFSSCSSALQRVIMDQPERFPINLQRFRRLDLNLRRLVEMLDNDMKYLFAIWFGTTVPLVCFMLYSLLGNSWDIFFLLLHVFWFVACMALLTVSSTFASVLHETAHSQLESLYDVSMAGASIEQIGQFQQFLSVVQSRSTGFTAAKLVIVSKELMLTVAGVFITYTIVLQQF